MSNILRYSFLLTQYYIRLTHLKSKRAENFDVEVHKKLKINLEESTQYINQYEQWLWAITEFALADTASFYPDYEFEINDNANKVRYKITKNLEGNFHHYRISHPVAQSIIEQCKGLIIDNSNACFHYSDQDKKITVLRSRMLRCYGG